VTRSANAFRPWDPIPPLPGCSLMQAVQTTNAHRRVAPVGPAVPALIRLPRSRNSRFIALPQGPPRFYPHCPDLTVRRGCIGVVQAALAVRIEAPSLRDDSLPRTGRGSNRRRARARKASSRSTEHHLFGNCWLLRARPAEFFGASSERGFTRAGEALAGANFGRYLL